MLVQTAVGLIVAGWLLEVLEVSRTEEVMGLQFQKPASHENLDKGC